jgi:hypothetical protein
MWYENNCAFFSLPHFKHLIVMLTLKNIVICDLICANMYKLPNIELEGPLILAHLSLGHFVSYNTCFVNFYKLSN